MKTLDGEIRPFSRYNGKAFVRFYVTVDTPPTALNEVSGVLFLVTPNQACSLMRGGSTASLSVEDRRYFVTCGHAGGYMYLPYGGQIDFLAIDHGVYDVQAEEIQVSDIATTDDLLDTVNIPEAAIAQNVEVPRLAKSVIYDAPAININLEYSYNGTIGAAPRLVHTGFEYPINGIKYVIPRTAALGITFKIAVPRPRST